ncbi:hypothetical protein CAPGI0001_1278 [Capnocytophaga gingivalis ATCC 33624]|nr:hypothetical protein CAPGI0001_1278 [Capnocytophaga gingivalis ATCC 33624]
MNKTFRTASFYFLVMVTCLIGVYLISKWIRTVVYNKCQ